MTFAQLFLILVVAIPLVFVSRNRLRADLAAVSIAVVLALGQLLGLGLLGAEHSPEDAIKAFSGFSEPVILMLFSLFIITQSLHQSGATRWIAFRLIDLGGNSERRLIVLYATATAIISLFMNNLAAGALLLPSAMETCRRTGIKPSKLLIPVAYGSLLGGSATYFTTANIILSHLLTSADPPQAMLHVLDFTPTGGLIALAGIAFLAFFGPRLLPNRQPPAELMITGYTSSDLEEYYQLSERLWEALVLPDSELANRSISESRIGSQLGLAVAGVLCGRQAVFSPSPDQIVHPGDILLVVGREERVQELAKMGVRIGRETTNNQISAHAVSLIEALAAPHSQALGHTLREMEFRTRYDFTVLALSRDGRSYRTSVADLTLKMGDSLLMIGSREKLRRLQKSPDFIVLEPDMGDRPVRRAHAALTVGVIAAGILASILGVPVYLAMPAGTLVLLMAGLLSMEEAYRAVDWQVMGGQVTALVTGPIMISVAIHLHTSPQAVAVATAIGCPASFLTPIAHPVNILMIAPANYQFKDFFRIGWRLTIVCFLMLLAGLVLFWGL